MGKNSEEHCVTALEWRPEGKRRPAQPKQHGGEWLNTKDEQLGGSRGQLSEL